jgi:ribonuclease I
LGEVFRLLLLPPEAAALTPRLDLVSLVPFPLLALLPRPAPVPPRLTFGSFVPRVQMAQHDQRGQRLGTCSGTTSSRYIYFNQPINQLNRINQPQSIQTFQSIHPINQSITQTTNSQSNKQINKQTNKQSCNQSINQSASINPGNQINPDNQSVQSSNQSNPIQ